LVDTISNVAASPILPAESIAACWFVRREHKIGQKSNPCSVKSRVSAAPEFQDTNADRDIVSQEVLNRSEIWQRRSRKPEYSKQSE
jgi:hypothetical protein